MAESESEIFTPVEPAPELVEWVFSSNTKNPFPAQILHMFYDAVRTNRLGIMEAKNADTGEIAALLVGIDVLEDNKVNTYPLARIFTPDDAQNWLAPRGDGTFIGEDEADVE